MTLALMPVAAYNLAATSVGATSRVAHAKWPSYATTQGKRIAVPKAWQGHAPCCAVPERIKEMAYTGAHFLSGIVYQRPEFHGLYRYKAALPTDLREWVSAQKNILSLSHEWVERELQRAAGRTTRAVGKDADSMVLMHEHHRWGPYFLILDSQGEIDR